MLTKIIWVLVFFISSGERLLIVAAVPTATKAGVSIIPWLVVIWPQRARFFLLFFITSNLNIKLYIVIPSEALRRLVRGVVEESFVNQEDPSASFHPASGVSFRSG